MIDNSSKNYICKEYKSKFRIIIQKMFTYCFKLIVYSLLQIPGNTTTLGLMVWYDYEAHP